MIRVWCEWLPLRSSLAAGAARFPVGVEFGKPVFLGDFQGEAVVPYGSRWFSLRMQLPRPVQERFLSRVGGELSLSIPVHQRHDSQSKRERPIYEKDRALRQPALETG
jgi:hypothetical protein